MGGSVYDNKGPILLTVNIFFLSAAFITFLLRCYVRVYMVKSVGKDDWWMIASTISYILYTTFSTTGVVYGTGRHASNLTIYQLQHALKFWWLCYLFYTTTMVLSKISIGYYLLRVCINKVHIWIIYSAMIITAVAGIVFFFVSLLQCNPISHFWDRSQPGSCLNFRIVIALLYLYSGISVITDLTFTILPIFVVWNLKLDTRTKIVIIPLLAMGCIASFAIVVRMRFLFSIIDPDFLWATINIAIWSTIEQGLAITAGCLATTRPLLRLISDKFGSTTVGSNITGGSQRGQKSNMNSRRNKVEQRWAKKILKSQGAGGSTSGIPIHVNGIMLEDHKMSTSTQGGTVSRGDSVAAINTPVSTLYQREGARDDEDPCNDYEDDDESSGWNPVAKDEARKAEEGRKGASE